MACRELIWQSLAQRGLFRQDPATWPALARIDDLDAGLPKPVSRRR
jgi:hypothetical protein